MNLSEIKNSSKKVHKRTRLLFYIGIGFSIGIFSLFNLPGQREQDLLFIVPAKGSWHLSQNLAKSEIISSSVLFRLAVFLRFGPSPKAGEYLIRHNDSYADIIKKMANQRTAWAKFTIPEGYSHHAISEALQINTLLEGKLEALPEEGTLLPETYIIRRGLERSRVVKRMHRAYHRLMKKLWAQRAPDLPFTSMRDAMILASIVEKETGVKAERGEVAGVFINRLSKDHYMQLQSDPTVIYALTRGKPLERSLTYKDLANEDPYNSYRHYGLPPGAIANPGQAAIEAVLNPAKTKNFYFVADGTGGHAFAETYEGHLENVKKWRAIQQKAREEKEATQAAAQEKESKVAETDKEAVAAN